MNKDTTLTIRLSNEMKKEIDAKAKEQGRSMGNYLQWLHKGGKPTKPKPSKPTTFVLSFDSDDNIIYATVLSNHNAGFKDSPTLKPPTMRFRKELVNTIMKYDKKKDKMKKEAL